MEKSKKIVLILIIGILFTSQVCLSQETGDVKEIVTIDNLTPDSPFSKIWQPFIASWKQNYYVVAYGLQLKGKSDMGDSVCSITKDGGKTWTPPIYIFNHRLPNGTQNFAYNNAVLFKPKGQNIIWCFAMRCPQYYPNSEDSELCAAYSCDGGVTWQHIELTMEFHSHIITCAGIVPVKEDGITKYLLPLHRNTKRHDPKGDREQFVLESTNLLSWKLIAYIPRP